MPLLRLLERIAAVLRRLGLGGLVDRTRTRALRTLGDFTERVGDVVLSGDVERHSHYVRELQESDRERATAERFREAVHAGAVVLDVGAHLGYFTALAAKRGATVVAFEPNPRTLPYLRRNVEANGVADRVRIVERAAAASDGTATFFLSPAGDESSLHGRGAGDEPVSVRLTPVDAETSGLSADVIKLDVEGAEIEALEGMRDTIARASPDLVVFVERNPEALRRAGHEPEELDAALEAEGLRVAAREEEAESGYVNLVCRRA